MALDYVIKSTTTTAAGSVRLIHGSDEASAVWIATKGLDRDRLVSVQGAYAFCTTIDPKIATMYAQLNPARGVPALLSFEIPQGMVQEFLVKDPPWVTESIEDSGYLFLPDSFPVMNSVMTNFSVQIVTDLKLTF